MLRSLKYKVCPHCSRSLNVKTFKEHKRLFFSEESSTWIVETHDTDTDSSDISIEPGDSEIEESLYDDMMTHEQPSSSDMDMDVFPEASDSSKVPQPSAISSSDSSQPHSDTGKWS